MGFNILSFSKLSTLDYLKARVYGLPNFNEIKNKASAIVQKQCHKDGLAYDFEIHLILCDNAYIASLNEKYRSQLEPTDVLSFPLFHFPNGAGTSSVKGDDLKQKEIFETWPLQGNLLLGDLVISVPTCTKQGLGKESFARKKVKMEFWRLFIHGFLHLLGYDHETSEEDASRMQKIERELYY